MVHLSAARSQQGLFARSTGHGACAQIRDKGPSSEYGRMTWFDCVDIDQSCQTFSNRLHNRASDRRRGRGACLPSTEQQNRHAAGNAFFHDLTAFCREFHGRHNKAIGIGHKGALAPFILTACNHMQHFKGIIDKIRLRKGGANMFFRTGGASVYCVEIHLSIVENIAADHRSLHEMDIVQMFHNTSCIVQVADSGFAVTAALHVNHMHRGPGGAVMNLLFAEVQIVFRISRAKRDFAVGFG